MLCERSSALPASQRRQNALNFKLCVWYTPLASERSLTRLSERSKRKKKLQKRHILYFSFLFFRSFVKRARKNASDVKIAVELKGCVEMKRKKISDEKRKFRSNENREKRKSDEKKKSLQCSHAPLYIHFYFSRILQPKVL